MGSKRKTYRDTNVKSTRIDRATGQNKRVKVTQPPERGGPRGVARPVRQGGRVVPKSRLAFQRARRATVRRPGR